MFENRAQKKVFGHKREEATGHWGNCIMRNFIICTLHGI
jgi:hypothetical protein